MIVVALLYNKNGMATWCIETARALHAEGKEVLLVFDDKQRPDLVKAVFPFPTFPFSFNQSMPTATGLFGKAVALIRGTFDNSSSGFAYELEKALSTKGIIPKVFLFNQTNLQDDRCQTSQHVVAWAYPATLWGYLAKTIQQSNSVFSLRFLFALSGAISWYRKDWRAYRSSGVMTVSERLAKELQSKGIQVRRVYPPLTLVASSSEQQMSEGVHILMAAIDLENPQKRISWALETLSNSALKHQVQFHLVGNYSYLKEKVRDWGLTATFYGLRTREELKDIMAHCGVFIFSSSFDDWGYVQVEALAQGMVVLAPNISPSDEIIGKQEWLFDPNSEKSLLVSFESLILKGVMREERKYALDRSKMFNSKSFISQLGNIVS